MVREVKWTKYLWMSLLSFGAFMLEFLSIFGIEVIFLHVDIQNYTTPKKYPLYYNGFHVGIFHWCSPAFFKEILSFSRKREQRGQDFLEKLDSNACLLHWLQNYDFY